MRLHAERFVTFERNKGYRVAPKPDALEMRQLFAARLILEIGAVEHGLGRVDAAVIAELRRINAELQTLDPSRSIEAYRAFIATNERFHVVLVGLSANSFIINSYRRLGYHQRIIQRLFGKGVPDRAPIVAEHETIIEALAKGDPDAVRAAMHRHISRRLRAPASGRGFGLLESAFAGLDPVPEAAAGPTQLPPARSARCAPCGAYLL